MEERVCGKTRRDSMGVMHNIVSLTRKSVGSVTYCLQKSYLHCMEISLLFDRGTQLWPKRPSKCSICTLYQVESLIGPRERLKLSLVSAAPWSSARPRDLTCGRLNRYYLRQVHLKVVLLTSLSLSHHQPCDDGILHSMGS